MEDRAMKRETLLLTALIGALSAIHLATLRDGQEWGDDFSLYVAHARNMAEGRPYADTGYIYNLNNPVVSPRAYPPIFPLLLVPVYLVFGMNLTAMKAFVILLFTALLGVLAALLRKRLPTSYIAVCLTLFALNPYVWQHKDRLLSEIPYMLFAYATLLWAEKASEASSRRQALVWGLLAGFTAYLAFGTRTVGAMLIPSILLADWLRRRRFGIAASAFLLAFLVGVALQKSLLVVEGSYLDQLVFAPSMFARIALSLPRAFGTFFDNGYNNALRWLLFSCATAFAVWGYGRRRRERWTACELFAVLSCLPLVIWPAAEYERRFLLPILPLFLLYAAEGIRLLRTTRLASLELPAAATLAWAIALSYAVAYSLMETGPIRDGVSTSESVALFQWIKDRTDTKDVFLFQKPKALALYGQRRALAHERMNDPALLDHTLRRHGTTHLVVNRASPLPTFRSSRHLVEAFVAKHPDRFETVYDTSAFHVYRLRQTGLASR
jgi:hypothetical protein